MAKQPVYNLLSNEIKNLDKDSKLILEDLKLSVLKLKDIVSKKKEYYNSWQYQIDLCKEVINDFKKKNIIAHEKKAKISTNVPCFSDPRR